MEKEKDFKNPQYYENRELSWLKFDNRVLNEARDKSIPLLERLKFVSITSSNLDEFYRVRVGTAANNTEISIPKTFNNKDVTVILENGFANCQNLVTISIPDSIIEIRDSGFKNCINLTDVELPANLDSI